jgi:two-component system, chemotaxis family, protein-glutamate methylesterase/glutaminase
MGSPAPGGAAPELVMIGVSAGGLEAMSVILPELTERLGFALAIVQHRSPSSEALCQVLQQRSRVLVSEVNDKEPIEGGRVYIAPPDYHLLVERGHFSLSVDAPEMYSRPSIDLAFESAADAYGPRVAGVVLTGANSDGARGLRRIADRGGVAVVQDPATAEVPVMPAAALAAVPNAAVVPLDGIARHLSGLVARPLAGRGQAP